MVNHLALRFIPLMLLWHLVESVPSVRTTGRSGVDRCAMVCGVRTESWSGSARGASGAVADADRAGFPDRPSPAVRCSDGSRRG